MMQPKYQRTIIKDDDVALPSYVRDDDVDNVTEGTRWCE